MPNPKEDRTTAHADQRKAKQALIDRSFSHLGGCGIVCTAMILSRVKVIICVLITREILGCCGFGMELACSFVRDSLFGL